MTVVNLTIPDKLRADLERAYETAVGDGTDPLTPNELFRTIKLGYGSKGATDEIIKNFLLGKGIHVTI